MDWPGLIESLGSIPTASAQRVHLEAAWRETEELKQKVAALEAENHKLKEKVEELTPKHEYADGIICVFRKENGKAINIPLCTECKNPLFEAQQAKRWTCETCKTLFNHMDVQKSRRRVGLY